MVTHGPHLSDNVGVGGLEQFLHLTTQVTAHPIRTNAGGMEGGGGKSEEKVEGRRGRHSHTCTCVYMHITIMTVTESFWLVISTVYCAYVHVLTVLHVHVQLPLRPLQLSSM